VSKTKQADGGIHEDQLLNFLVNRLDEEVSLSLANNAEITAEDIYGVLRKDLDELLPEQVEVVSDLHLRPFYGDEDDTDGLYHSQAKRGTTAFHAYATLYARVKNKTTRWRCAV